MADIKAVTDADFETEVLKSDKPVLVDFWAVYRNGEVVRQIVGAMPKAVSLSELSEFIG